MPYKEQKDTNSAHVCYGFCRCARCKLQNVRVLNKGIDWESGLNMYWRHEVHRNECLKVMLHGNAEFEAIDVTLEVNNDFLINVIVVSK